jgi:hypothetical protein
MCLSLSWHKIRTPEVLVAEAVCPRLLPVVEAAWNEGRLIKGRRKLGPSAPEPKSLLASDRFSMQLRCARAPRRLLWPSGWGAAVLWCSHAHPDANSGGTGVRRPPLLGRHLEKKGETDERKAWPYTWFLVSDLKLDFTFQFQEQRVLFFSLSFS